MSECGMASMSYFTSLLASWRREEEDELSSKEEMSNRQEKKKRRDRKGSWWGCMVENTWRQHKAKGSCM